MDDSDVEGFDKFLEIDWGIKMKQYDDSTEEESEDKKVVKRGRKPKAVK